MSAWYTKTDELIIYPHIQNVIQGIFGSKNQNSKINTEGSFAMWDGISQL